MRHSAYFVVLLVRGEVKENERARSRDPHVPKKLRQFMAHRNSIPSIITIGTRANIIIFLFILGNHDAEALKDNTSLRVLYILLRDLSRLQDPHRLHKPSSDPGSLIPEREQFRHGTDNELSLLLQFHLVT